MKNLNAFANAVIAQPQLITGGTSKTCCCDPEPSKGAKGNNGIGQEKRGILDGPPPGLASQERQDFNDRSGNRHGVEV